MPKASNTSEAAKSPKATVNWQDVKTWERVVAAIFATGVKIDLSETAKHYGTTYNTLENRFRTVKKDAADMKAKAKDGNAGNGGETPKRSKTTPSTPRSKTPKKDALHTVADGRVSKSASSKKSGIKSEPADDDDDSG